MRELGEDERETAMRRDPFEQAQSDSHEFFRRAGLEAFIFQVLCEESAGTLAIYPTRQILPKIVGHGVSAQKKRDTYIYTKILVNLHELPKDSDVLHETGKLPTVTQSVQQAGLFRGLLGGSVHLGAGALSRYHGGGSKPFKAPRRRARNPQNGEFRRFNGGPNGRNQSR